MFDVSVEGEAEFFREVQSFVTDLQKGAEQAVSDACTAGVAQAKQGAFKDGDGNLRRQIYWTLLESSAAGAEGEMRSPVFYSSYVDGGTPAHDIWPKQGEGFKGPTRRGQSRRTKDDIGTHRVALRWVDGGVHFARMVHHPGSNPYPFMGPAYLTAERVLTARMELLASQAGERFT